MSIGTDTCSYRSWRISQINNTCKSLILKLLKKYDLTRAEILFDAEILLCLKLKQLRRQCLHLDRS
jgi:hypothetical protein